MSRASQWIRYWPVDSFIHWVEPNPPDYVIRHAGTTYPSLADAEHAARDSFRVITYGPPREGQKDQP